MNCIAIIPARGGSKGIPGKNIRLVGGKPLLAWSIEHARRTPGISAVFVSTDSPEIASIARDYHAEVIDRPAEISGDTASSESCLRHALDFMKAQNGSEPDLVVFLQATSPMRAHDEIEKAIHTLETANADSLFSACRVEGFVWRVEKDGAPRSFNYDHLNRPRRQDAPEDLIENGSIYIFKPWVLRKFNNRLGGKVAVHRMNALDSFQIDEPADLELVEALMASRNRAHPMPESAQFPLRGVASPCLITGPDKALTSPLKLLVLDFDGVLTDNRVMVFEDGREAVHCDRGDGYGIEQLRRSGMEIVVLSKEKNPVVGARCRKLGIECQQGCENKLAALRKMAMERNLHPKDVAYVGNDLNDLECLKWVGLPIAVADAVPEVRSVACVITSNPGGRGAVRDVSDWLLANKS